MCSARCKSSCSSRVRLVRIFGPPSMLRRSGKPHASKAWWGLGLTVRQHERAIPLRMRLHAARKWGACQAVQALPAAFSYGLCCRASLA